MSGRWFWLQRARRKVTARIERRFLDPQRILVAQAALSVRRGRTHTYQDLWDLELRVFSQFGEDGILDFLCDQLSIAKPRVVEIGAGDFTECNSRFLAENRSASVYAVDGSPGLAEGISRMPLAWRTSLWAREVWVTPDSVSQLVREAREVMGGIDILTLDLDGNDYWILQETPLDGISLVVVEYNPMFGGTRAISVPRDDAFDRRQAHHSWLYYGASICAFVKWMDRFDFTFIGTNRAGNNAFFVPREHVNDLAIRAPASSDIVNYSKYTDWRVRESRNERGELALIPAHDAYSILQGLPVVNTESGEWEVL